MAGFHVTLDQAALRSEMSGQNGLVWREIQRRGNAVLNAARRNAPVDEGRLRASLSMNMQSGASGPTAVIGSNLDYAMYVHEGTGIYAGRGFITPKRARFLSWPVKNNSGAGRRRYRDGRTQTRAYARRVRGVKGRPFLKDALDAAR